MDYPTGLLALKELIRSNFPLRQLAELAGAQFKNASSPCPLHRGDNPTAFHIYDSGYRWHCFTRCPPDANDGDLFTFYIRWKNVDFTTAMQELADLAGISPSRESFTFPSPNTPITVPKSFLSSLHKANQLPLSFGSGLSHSTPLETILNSRFSNLLSSNPNPSPPSPTWQSRAQAFIDYARSQLLDLQIGAPARAYLFSERGLTSETQATFQLGYNPKDIYDQPERWGFEPGDRKIWLPRGIVIPGLRDGHPWYIKIRRPIRDDLLTDYLPLLPMGEWSGMRGKSPKFSSPRGSVSTLFGSDHFLSLPTLLLVEGEFDCMLAWQHVHDQCDIATLGGALTHPHFQDLAFLSRYGKILAVYDSDLAGDHARSNLSQITRIKLISPPAHDISDYFRLGRDLFSWLTLILSDDISN